MEKGDFYNGLGFRASQVVYTMLLLPGYAFTKEMLNKFSEELFDPYGYITHFISTDFGPLLTILMLLVDFPLFTKNVPAFNKGIYLLKFIPS